MSKYIDADRLIAELRRQKRWLEHSIQSQGDYGQSCHIIAYENIISLIASLQKEQPELDLEKEYRRFIDCNNGRSMYECARHFAEWGATHLNARKEE